MRKGLVNLFFAAMAMALPFAAAHAQDRAETLFNLVSVSAQAEREVANDTLTAVMAVDAEGSDPVALADGANLAMRDALKVAQAYLSVKARSLNYQTWPVYDKARIVRWRVRQELRLESREFAQATELIGKLQAGLVVSSLAVGLSSDARKQAENALIVEALAAFRARAEIVREAQKATGYRVKDLQINAGGGVQPRMYAAQRAGVSAASVAAPSVEPGASTILVNVSGTVQLQ
jgi:predicted secreted protein